MIIHEFTVIFLIIWIIAECIHDFSLLTHSHLAMKPYLGTVQSVLLTGTDHRASFITVEKKKVKKNIVFDKIFNSEL